MEENERGMREDEWLFDAGLITVGASAARLHLLHHLLNDSFRKPSEINANRGGEKTNKPDCRCRDPSW